MVNRLGIGRPDPEDENGNALWDILSGRSTKDIYGTDSAAQKRAASKNNGV